MTSSGLARRLGISVRRINELVQAGLITPTVRRSRKQGSRAIWSEEDAEDIIAMLQARRHLVRLARCQFPATRILAQPDEVALAVGGPRGVLIAVKPSTTIGQLMAKLGGGPFAVIPKEDS